MKKLLIFLFLVFLLYPELVDTLYKNYDDNGNLVITGTFGDWSYKQSTTSGGIKTEFISLDNINSSRIAIDFGETENEIDIFISSKKIKETGKYFLYISNKSYNSDYIIDYIKDKNISVVNGILSISDKTAHDLILYKFIKYDTIVLYHNNEENTEEIIKFNLKGLDKVFIDLGVISNR